MAKKTIWFSLDESHVSLIEGFARDECNGENRSVALRRILDQPDSYVGWKKRWRTGNKK